MPSKKQFSQEEKEEITRRYKEGESSRDIAKDFPCSKGPILRIVNNYNLDTDRGNKISEKHLIRIPKETLKELYVEERMTLGGVADQLDIEDTNVISRELRRHNIPIDPVRGLRKIDNEQKKEIKARYLDGESVYDLEKDYSVSATTIQKWLKKQDVELKGVTKRPTITKNWHFGYIIGVLKGDGSLTVNNRLQLKVIDKDFAQHFKDSIIQAFDLKPNVHSKQKTVANNTIYSVNIQSKKIADFLRNYSYKQIEKESQNLKAAFLRGIYDSELTVTPTNIRIGTTEKDVIKHTKKMLEDLNIETLPIHSYKKEGNRKEFYIFHIRKNSTKTYLDKVGFSIERKMTSAKNITGED